MRTTLLLALALTTIAAARATPDLALLHFELSRSAPLANETAHHVAEVRLWFTGEPTPNTTSIRVLTAADAAVETGAVVQDEKDGRIVSVALQAPLAPGGYKVSWRALGDDGHVVRGEFGFTVASH